MYKLKFLIIILSFLCVDSKAQLNYFDIPLGIEADQFKKELINRYYYKETEWSSWSLQGKFDEWNCYLDIESDRNNLVDGISITIYFPNILRDSDRTARKKSLKAYKILTKRTKKSTKCDPWIKGNHLNIYESDPNHFFPIYHLNNILRNESVWVGKNGCVFIDRIEIEQKVGEEGKRPLYKIMYHICNKKHPASRRVYKIFDIQDINSSYSFH